MSTDIKYRVKKPNCQDVYDCQDVKNGRVQEKIVNISLGSSLYQHFNFLKNMFIWSIYHTNPSDNCYYRNILEQVHYYKPCIQNYCPSWIQHAPFSSAS